MRHSVRCALIHEVAYELVKYPIDTVNRLLPVEACVHQPLRRATHGRFTAISDQCRNWLHKPLSMLYVRLPVVSKKENMNDN
jgi:hypothetical protein